MRDDKISFDDYIKSGDMLANEAYDKQDVFTDTPRKFDFTVLVLLIISLACVALTLGFYHNATEPIDDTVSISVISVESGISASSKTNNEIININTADVQQLCQLKHIGETRALNIISYRMANGNFEKIEDLLKVSGIGEGIFEDIKDKICV